MSPDVAATTTADRRPKMSAGQRKKVSACIGRYRGHEKDPKVAIAKCFSMAREGKLGPSGGYRKA